MRFAGCAALVLLLAAVARGPASAPEPGVAEGPLTRAEAIRIAIQEQLAATFTKPTKTKLSEQGALVEFYAAPEQHPLFVDENGLTERGKAVIAEIEKADDYGLRARDYALPALNTLDAAGSNATQWLADAEIKISYAVLDYARDARGGRIEPERISPNLDPTLTLPNPAEVIDSIAIRTDPAAYLRSFQPDHPQFEALRQKLLELRGRKSETPKPAIEIPDGPVLKLGVEHEQVALLRKRLDIASENPDGTPRRRDAIRRRGRRGRQPFPTRSQRSPRWRRGPGNETAPQWRPIACRDEPRQDQSDTRQYGALALAAARPWRVLRGGEYS